MVMVCENLTWKASIPESDVTCVSLKEFDVDSVDVHILVRVC
jgi:hypothetical protein